MSKYFSIVHSILSISSENENETQKEKFIVNLILLYPNRITWENVSDTVRLSKKCVSMCHTVARTTGVSVMRIAQNISIFIFLRFFFVFVRSFVCFRFFPSPFRFVAESIFQRLN